MNKEQVIAQIRSVGILPVIRTSTADEARAAIDAVAAAGITTIEITLTVSGAIELIQELSESRKDLLIGAGTVLTAASARECADAGARFIISPVTDVETIRFCNDAGIVVMPGALTPTEILYAWNAGADFVKVFPADSMGGPSYLKTIKGPLPEIRLVPTGGVSLSTVGDFIKAGAEAVGIGSDLVDVASFRDGRPSAVTGRAAEYMAAVSRARSQ